MVILRDGREQTLSVTLREAQSSRQAQNAQDEESDRSTLGVAVTPLTPALKERAGLPDDAKGLLVQSVNPDGRAARAGIRQGDHRGVRGAAVAQLPLPRVERREPGGGGGRPVRPVDDLVGGADVPVKRVRAGSRRVAQ